MSSVLQVCRLAVLLTCLCGSAGAWPYVGMVAPNFTLNRSSGGSETLSNYAGDVVYLYFFGATCPTCVADGPLTEDIYQEFLGDSSAKVMGIDVWNLPAFYVNGTFRTNTGITYTLLVNGRTTGYAYDMENGGSSATDNEGRGHLVIDQFGIIRYYANWDSFGTAERDEIIELMYALLDPCNSLPQLETPQQLTISVIDESLELCWLPVPCALRYRVSRSIAGDFSDEMLIDVTPNSTTLITDFPDESAVYRIVAERFTEN